MRLSIKEVLMKRDGVTSDEADEMIKDAKELLNEYLENGELDLAEDICLDEFGLEPDYIMDLM